jgi:hypothetical protein
VATNDTGSTLSVQDGVFTGYCRDVNGSTNFESPPHQCWLNGMAVGTACAGTYESCEQRSNGAFGPAGGLHKTITVIGTPAGSILSGPAAATLASLFAVPPSGSATVDGFHDWPGPGAVALRGTATLCAIPASCP